MKRKKSSSRNRPYIIIGLVGLFLLGGFIFAVHQIHLGRKVSGVSGTGHVVAHRPSQFSFPPGRGKIAIVLDDWGYNLHQLPALTAISEPLTLSILPNLPFSGQVATKAHAHGHEVILHMPMEAQDPHAPREAGTLLTTMSREEVLRRLDRSLATIPLPVEFQTIKAPRRPWTVD